MKVLKYHLPYIKLFMLFVLTALPFSITFSAEIDVRKTIVQAKNNDKQALYDLAVLKHMGLEGVEINLPEAIALYKRASALGHRSANQNLGLMYYKGVGVNVDYVEAAKWFEIGAERNLDDSKRMLLIMNKYELIPRNDKKLESLLIEFAHKGKQEDIEQLADYYYYTKNDLLLAEKPTVLLAEKGLAKYQHRLGMIYYRGTDGKPNYKKAYPWILKAAEANDLNGKISVASFYLGGLGVQQDFEKAAAWFNSAYEQDPVKTCEIHSLVLSELNNETQQCELSRKQ